MKMLRWFLRLTLLASLALLIALLVGPGRGAGGPPLRFESNPFVIPEIMHSGMEYDFDAVVVNESTDTARVVGAGDYCADSCYSGRALPAVVKPQGRGHVTVHIKAGAPGDFSGDLTFYTDCPSQPTLTVALKGTVRGDQPLEAESHTTKP